MAAGLVANKWLQIQSIYEYQRLKLEDLRGLCQAESVRRTSILYVKSLHFAKGY